MLEIRVSSKIVKAAVAGASLGAFLLIAGAAQALPLFSIEAGGWADEINAGRVQVAADPLSGAAGIFYNSTIGQNMFGVPVAAVQAALNVQLTPDFAISDGNKQEDALVMSWDNNPGDDVLNVAGWEYVYDVDPDLTGTRIRFSLLAPVGIWDFSLELFDIFGNSVGWFGVPPSTIWGNFLIDPGLFAPQGPFTAFVTSGPFDITQVVRIRLSESSQGGVTFIDNPALVGQSITPWNAWNSLAVVPVPEPGTLALFGIGIAGLGFLRRRRQLP